MSARRVLLSLVLVLVGVSVTSARGFAGAQAPATAKPCLLVAKGAPWSYKGQKGTSYNVLGVSGGSCQTGVKWLVRFTHSKGYGFKGPTGWTCIAATTYLGECTIKAGGIVEWAPKLKK
jgi:hypothetical protein